MKFKTGLSSLTNKLVLSMAVLTLSAFVLPAHAAKFGVRVVDDNGIPVAGASVCVGLQGNYKQFGATFTDSQGQVVVEVPNVPLLVTVSKDRFTGMRATEPARSFNLIKQVQLREGVPGPRCRAGSKIAEGPGAGIVVTDIAIKTGEFSTTLSPTVNGDPSHYRVSSDKDFSDAKWETFSNQISLAGNLSDSQKVYLQLRKRTGSSKAWMEARSEIVTVRLN